MRFRISCLTLAPALLIAACSSSTSPTDAAAAGDLTSVIPDFANSAAAMIDPAGIGGAQFPDSIALTVEQKATIDSLHAAFEAATAADVAALQSIQSQARTAHQAGKSNTDIGAILAQAVPILTRLYGELTTLQNNIEAVYTPAQKAWIAAHQLRACGPGGPPTLTDDQMQQIKALQDAFTAAVKNDVAYIRQIADSAHEAERAGETRDQVQAILQLADAAQARVRAAEQKLQQDIEAVLTPAQKSGRCGTGGLGARG